MPRYSDETIEEIRSRINIVDFIGKYVNLQKRGSGYVGLCPFHSEKTPSFYISPDKQLYHCFGCGEAGTVYQFIMNYDNITFPEAIKELAREANVELKETGEETKEDREKKRLKERLFSMYKDTAIYYYSCLKSKYGERGYKYLKDRKLSDETIQRFGLGYSISARGRLLKYLRNKGYTNDEILKSHLFRYSEKDGFLDKFYNRVMFPIMDEQKRVVAFGARVMGQGEPKYLNSDDTLIFSKRHLLYGMHIARRTREKMFILCEGYMDVIALQQAGFLNAVASLGTALSDENASYLKRLKKDIYLSYDSDGAGVKATLRAVDMFIKRDVTIKVIDMRPYKDPDEFIKGLGKEEYQKRIDNAKNGFIFSLEASEKDYDLKDPNGKTLFQRHLASRVLIFKNELERKNYSDEICKKYGILPEMFNNLIRDEAKKGVKDYTNLRFKEENGFKDSKAFGMSMDKAKNGLNESEKLLLSYLLDDKKVYEKVKAFITSDDFEDDINKDIYSEIQKAYDANSHVNIPKIVNRYFETNDHKKVVDICDKKDMLAKGANRDKVLSETLIKIKKHAIDRENQKADQSDPSLFKKKIEDKKFLEKLKLFKVE